MSTLPARLRARLDEIEAAPVVTAVALFLAAFLAALILGWQATPFITTAALVYAQLAYREARAARAQMVRNVNGIHQAGMDAHRALGALKGLEAAAPGIETPSTGRHSQ